MFRVGGRGGGKRGEGWQVIAVHRDDGGGGVLAPVVDVANGGVIAVVGVLVAQGGEGGDDLSEARVGEADGVVARGLVEADHDRVALAGEHLDSMDFLGFDVLAVDFVDPHFVFVDFKDGHFER